MKTFPRLSHGRTPDREMLASALPPATEHAWGRLRRAEPAGGRPSASPGAPRSGVVEPNPWPAPPDLAWRAARAHGPPR
eukprot:6075195-Alexandrium_andersonii.AAC.1